MNWSLIQDALDDLPESVIQVLSGQIRADLSSKQREVTPSRGVDHSKSGGRISDWTVPTGRGDVDVNRTIIPYKDLQIGWRIARECAEQGVEIPSSIAWNCEPIYRAWVYNMDPQGFGKDKPFKMALALQTGALSGIREKVKAAMLSQDASFSEISSHYNIDEEALRIFDNLFFSVSGRKEDALWLSNIVYPNSRMVEFYDNYTEQASLQSLLLRAGYKNGFEHVMQISGMSRDPLDTLEASVTAQQLEAVLMAQGLMMAQNGWVNNQHNATAIFHARHLMTASKIGGEDTMAGSEYMSMGDTLWQQMLNVKKPAAEKALRMQNMANAIPVEAEEI